MSRKQAAIQVKKARQSVKMGLLQQALSGYQQALEYDPENLDALVNLGELSVRLQMLDAALAWFDIALKLQSNDRILLLKAGVLTRLGKDEEAMVLYEELLERKPSHFEALMGYGSVLLNARHLSKALMVFEKAFKSGKDKPACLNNIGIAHLHNLDYSQAIDFFEKALKLRKGEPHIGFNLASAYLKKGDLKQGWAYYENRHHPKYETASVWNHEIPFWTGQDLTGKTILVPYDQGIGDMFFFATCLNELIPICGKVIMEVHEKTVDFYKWNFPEIDIRSAVFSVNATGKTTFLYDWVEEEDLRVDYFCPLGTIFGHLRPDISRFPLLRAPLSVPSKVFNDILTRLMEINPDQLPKIGLSWRSSLMTGRRNHAYMTVDECAEQIAKVETKSLIVNTQYKLESGELKLLEDTCKASGHQFTNFDDIDLFNDIIADAALLGCMDIVVAPDTAQSVIAAAMGVPVLTFGEELFKFGFEAFRPIFPMTLVSTRQWGDDLNMLVGGAMTPGQMLVKKMKVSQELDAFLSHVLPDIQRDASIFLDQKVFTNWTLNK